MAVLESADGFEHHLTYLPSAKPEAFVSLAMPVQSASWNWPALHPFFQVSLPEGFLLSVLEEQLGPHRGAGALDLLSVVGHNLIGRVQVSVGAQPNAVAAVENLEPLLHGAASQQVFLELMALHAASGVSGVVPKFLTSATQVLFRKGTLTTERHIVKASSEHQPFVALNEYLCMQAAAATGVDVARTLVSDDGQILVVERFDIDPQTGRRKGFEDFCSLLALLLTHALGNADCQPKNLAFVYGGFDDVKVAPVYDMLTILAYDRYADNPRGKACCVARNRT